jgi:tetratricopeptide (TPR) repeat protein
MNDELARVRQMTSESNYLFSRLETLYPDRAFARIGLALLAIDTGEFRRALTHCEGALKAIPDYGIAHACRGLALLCLERRPLAMDAFRAAIRSGEPAAVEMAHQYIALAGRVSREGWGRTVLRSPNHNKTGHQP